MKKMLVVLTNVDRFEADGEPTGLWLAEATEFVDAVTQAGYQVDYASPRGGVVPIDPRSMEDKFVKERDRALYESEDFATRALEQSMPAADVDPSAYVALYFAGGHGVMWDFPSCVDLQSAARAIYEAGGYVTSVCHGVAGLFNVDLSDGSRLIAGKTITGFTDKEELLSGKKGKVPFSNEEKAKQAGAAFKKALPFHEHVEVDGRLITGQNPQSGAAVARALLAQLS